MSAPVHGSDVKPNTRTIVLVSLCALALAWWAKMLFGTVQLGWHQGITWSVDLRATYHQMPVILVAIEFLLMLGAALIPLVVTLNSRPSIPRWTWYVWAPCMLYVLFLCVNFYIRVPFALLPYAKTTLRLLGWLAIAVLFLRSRRKVQAA